MSGFHFFLLKLLAYTLNANDEMWTEVITPHKTNTTTVIYTFGEKQY